MTNLRLLLSRLSSLLPSWWSWPGTAWHNGIGLALVQLQYLGASPLDILFLALAIAAAHEQSACDGVTWSDFRVDWRNGAWDVYMFVFWPLIHFLPRIFT